MAALPETEVAWAAGFYDGEGSCSRFFGKAGVRCYLRLHVGQKDPRPLRRFHAVVGVGKIVERTMNAQPFFDWRVQALTDVAVVENVLSPFLSEPKREQFARERAAARLARETSTRTNT